MKRTASKLFETTVVGSYPQPSWLVDRALLADNGVPRVDAKAWRIPEPFLQAAQDDATLVAVRDMERAGIDIVSDGEIRRDSYSNHFLLSLTGVDQASPSIVRRPNGQDVRIPRIVGKIARRGPTEVEAVRFLKRNTDRAIKITLPGPFTMAQLVHNEFYSDLEELAMAFAEAVNAEARDLESAGADVIQLDEPYLRNAPDAANRYAVPAIDAAIRDVGVTTAIHLCFGYGVFVQGEKPKHYSFLKQLVQSAIDQISIEAAQPDIDMSVFLDLAPKTILLGVLALHPGAGVETPEQVAARIRAGLKYIPPERLVAAPDCGMKYLDRAVAFAKLKALSDGAALVRREYTGQS